MEPQPHRSCLQWKGTQRLPPAYWLRLAGDMITRCGEALAASLTPALTSAYTDRAERMDHGVDDAGRVDAVQGYYGYRGKAALEA